MCYLTENLKKVGNQQKKNSVRARAERGTSPDVAGYNPYRQTTYLCSAHRLTQLPADQGSEVAFVGRSNAGKSSVLNALTDHKGLARTSKQPGCTRQINFFDAGPDTRLADLPGYGYARAPGALRAHWGQFINAYLTRRRCLVGIVLIADARRGLTDYDRQLLSWLRTRATHVLLNKADKPGRSAAAQALLRVNKYLGETATAQLFSARTKQGLDELLETLDAWTGIRRFGDRDH